MANEVTGLSNSPQIIKPVGDSQRKIYKGRIRLMACEPLIVLSNEDSQTLYPPGESFQHHLERIESLSIFEFDWGQRQMLNDIIRRCHQPIPNQGKLQSKQPGSFFFGPHLEAHAVLDLSSGIKLMPLAVKVWNPKSQQLDHQGNPNLTSYANELPKQTNKQRGKGNLIKQG